MSAEEFNLEERVLCSDDTCIGLVGPDGRCKVCGAAYTGVEPLPKTVAKTVEGDSATAALATDDSPLPEKDEGESARAEEDGSVEERVCCPDDTCVGIIGPDGVCGTCGRSA